MAYEADNESSEIRDLKEKIETLRDIQYEESESVGEENATGPVYDQQGKFRSGGAVSNGGITFPILYQQDDFGDQGAVNLNIDISGNTGQNKKIRMIGDVGFAFTSPPSSIVLEEFWVTFEQDGVGNHSITTTPTGLKNAAQLDVLLDKTANSKTTFHFITEDGGVTYRGELVDLTSGSNQTPWLTDIDGDNHALNNVSSISITDVLGNPHGLLQGVENVGVRLALTTSESFSILDGITPILQMDSATGLQLFGKDLVMGNGGNIVSGGAGEGVTNIGHLDFVDNLSTPTANVALYSDGVELFTKSNINFNTNNITNVDDILFSTPGQSIITSSGGMIYNIPTGNFYTWTINNSPKILVNDTEIRLQENTNFVNHNISDVASLGSNGAIIPGTGFIRMEATDQLRWKNVLEDDDLWIDVQRPTLDSTTQDAFAFSVAGGVRLFIGQFDMDVKGLDIIGVGDIIAGVGTHDIGTVDLSFGRIYGTYFIPNTSAETGSNPTGLTSDGNTIVLNFDDTNVDAGVGIYEQGVQQFLFFKPSSNVIELLIGPDPFVLGETYLITLGEGSSSGQIKLTEGSGNDLIIDRIGGGVTSGVQIQVAGISTAIFRSDEIKIFEHLNVNSQDIENVKNLYSDDTAGKIGDLVTGTIPGGFNYYVSNKIFWDTDDETFIQFHTDGIDIISDDDILLNAPNDNKNITIQSLGVGGDVLIHASRFARLTVGANFVGVQDNAITFSGANLTLSSGAQEIQFLDAIPNASVSTPATTHITLFNDSTTGAISVKKDNGSTVNLEAVAAGGEVNTASNLGGGTFGLFANKSGVDLQFKSLFAGSNITLSQNATGVTINASDTSVALLTDIGDVTAVGAANTILKRNPAGDTWVSGNVLDVNVDASAAIQWDKISKVGSSLDDIDDVNVGPTISDDTVLKEFNGEWVDGKILNVNIDASAAIDWDKINKTGSILDDIGDVNVGPTPSENTVLKVVGGVWVDGNVLNVNIDASAAIEGSKINMSLDELNDTNVGPTISADTVLKEFGGVWVDGKILDVNVDASASIAGSKINMLLNELSNVGTTTTPNTILKTIDGITWGGGNIVDNNVDASADIQWDKISKTGSILTDIDDVSAVGAINTVLIRNAANTSWISKFVDNENVSAALITGFTDIGTVDSTNDRLLIWDASVNSLRKVAPSEIGGTSGEFFGPWTANHNAGIKSLTNLALAQYVDTGGTPRGSISGDGAAAALRISLVTGGKLIVSDVITDILEISLADGLKMNDTNIILSAGFDTSKLFFDGGVDTYFTGSGIAGRVYFVSEGVNTVVFDPAGLTIFEGDILVDENNEVDIGKPLFQFKDLWIDGIANIDSLLLSTGSTITEFSTDGTLSGNSNSVVPTENAVKTYVDNNSGGIAEPVQLSINTLTPQTLPTKTTIDAGISNVHHIILDRDIEFEITNPPPATKEEGLRIVIDIDGTGGYASPVWPPSLLNPPIIPTTPNTRFTVVLYTLNEGTLWTHATSVGSSSGGSGFSGNLSDLSINVNKNWQAQGISNLGSLTGVTGITMDDGPISDVTILGIVDTGSTARGSISGDGVANAIRLSTASGGKFIISDVITDIAEFTNAGGLKMLNSHVIDLNNGNITNVNEIAFNTAGQSITEDVNGLLFETSVGNFFTFGDGVTIFATLTVDGLFLNESFIQVDSIISPGVTGFDTVGKIFQDVNNNHHVSVIRNGGIIDLESGGVTNSISQGDSSVTVTDVGSGNVAIVLDGITKATITSTLFSIDDSIKLGLSSTDDITFTGSVDSNIIPKDQNIENLGEPAHQWNELHIDSIHNSTNIRISSPLLFDDLTANPTQDGELTRNGDVIAFQTPEFVIRRDSIVVNAEPAELSIRKLADNITINTIIAQLNFQTGITSPVTWGDISVGPLTSNTDAAFMSFFVRADNGLIAAMSLSGDDNNQRFQMLMGGTSQARIQPAFDRMGYFVTPQVTNFTLNIGTAGSLQIPQFNDGNPSITDLNQAFGAFDGAIGQDTADGNLYVRKNSTTWSLYKEFGTVP